MKTCRLTAKHTLQVDSQLPIQATRGLAPLPNRNPHLQAGQSPTCPRRLQGGGTLDHLTHQPWVVRQGLHILHNCLAQQHTQRRTSCHNKQHLQAQLPVNSQNTPQTATVEHAQVPGTILLNPPMGVQQPYAPQWSTKHENTPHKHLEENHTCLPIPPAQLSDPPLKNPPRPTGSRQTSLPHGGQQGTPIKLKAKVAEALNPSQRHTLKVKHASRLAGSNPAPNKPLGLRQVD